MWRGLAQKPIVRWVLILAAWTLIGLAFASQFNFAQSRRGYIVTWRFALITSLADWYVFALLSIPALWLSKHFSLAEVRWQRSLGVHLAASLVFAVLWVVLRVGVEKLRMLGRAPTFYFHEMLHWTLVRSFYFNLLVYWITIGVSHAFEFYGRYRDRELHALELQKLLAQARLEALQAQLNPHFLFNTLHAISALMHQDVESADRMITRLSDLLRLVLESTDTQEVPLRQEIAFLQRYLEIEQTRFRDRLQVRMHIDSDTWDVMVPNLILQPLVENAIRHGVEPKTKRGEIGIGARCERDRLHLQVRDNGPGLDAHQPLTEGVGLSNTRARLQHLYGSEHVFDVRNADEGGLVVSLSFPCRRQVPGTARPVAEPMRPDRPQAPES
jgi:two-component system, LytTR family, sensor kinase